MLVSLQIYSRLYLQMWMNLIVNKNPVSLTEKMTSSVDGL